MAKLNQLKWIFFDIGCTLVSEEKGWRIRLKEQAEHEDCKALGLTADDLYNEIILASINYQSQFLAVAEKYGFKDYVQYNPDYEELYFDTIEVLEALKNKYKLGIIANQLAGLKPRLDKLGISKYFDVILGSNDVGLHKPDLRFFELALKEANTTAEVSMMVGDRLDNDIYPAKKLGMKTVWIKRGFGKYQTPKNSDYEADIVVDELNELINIL